MTTLTRFEFQCPTCRVRLSIDEEQRGQSVTCPHCEESIAAPCYYVGQPGQRPVAVRESFSDRSVGGGGESLPVARTFTREDRRWSLQHLMLSTDKRFVGDAMLGARARRRFEFYCGDCGSIQIGRVWDIASQQPCSCCDSFVIIPAPRPRVGLRAPQTVARRNVYSPEAGLFCPQCGVSTPAADRSRHRRAYCSRCSLWF